MIRFQSGVQLRVIHFLHGQAIVEREPRAMLSQRGRMRSGLALDLAYFFDPLRASKASRVRT